MLLIALSLNAAHKARCNTRPLGVTRCILSKNYYPSLGILKDITRHFLFVILKVKCR